MTTRSALARRAKQRAPRDVAEMVKASIIATITPRVIPPDALQS